MSIAPVTDRTTLDHFRLAAFETLDIEADSEALDRLCRALAEELVARREGRLGLGDVPALITRLNALGHAFERQPRDDGWATWLQHTHDGDRHFYIHVELDEPDSVMVLYDETLEASVARRQAAMTPEDHALDQRIGSFYERGLALVDRYDQYTTLTEPDRVLICLYLLDTGVNNGGFGTWLTNTDGAYLEDARDFLERVGAQDLAAILAEVIEILPPFAGGLTDEAWDALEENAERFGALDDRFYQADESIALLTLDHLESLDPDAR